jgi:SOS response regulatory protein OraA/RecX
MIKTKSVWDRVLHYISFRPRTESEVRKFLGSDCSEELISKLKHLNFINDSQYADLYIKSRLLRSPRSARLLTLELKKRGITTSPKIDETSAAAAALAKRPRLTKEQAYRFLLSRGFASPTIVKALKIRYN